MIFGVFFLVVLPLNGVYSWGRGAPGDEEKTREAVCNDLMPLHYNLSLQDPLTNPFIVEVTKLPGNAGLEVFLKVSSEFEDALIMGFLVQGRNKLGEIIGTFDTEATDNITLTCKNTTVSQYKKQWKKEIRLVWLPSMEYKGEVFIQALVMKNTSEFWKFNATEHPYIDTTTCESTSGCFRCADDMCLVKWTPIEDKIRFDLETRGQHVSEVTYIAMGLSRDDKMGDDSVTECHLDVDGRGIVQISWNEGRSNEQFEENHKSISLIPGSTKVSIEDDILRCSFLKYFRSSSDPNSTNHKKVFYPGDDEYFLLVAIGETTDDVIEVHNERFHSNSKINFTTVDQSHEATSSKGNYLIKIHGVMMVVAWLLLASFSSLLPRYFKNKLTKVKIFQKPFWFAIHQSMMIMVVGLTVLSFVIIFIEVGGYAWLENPGSAHPPLGILVTILVLLNPIMAMFRCDSGSKNRWVFDLFHFFVGQSALMLAVVTIFLSVSIKKAGLPYWLNGLLAFHVCWHVVAELLLAAYDKYTMSLKNHVIKTGDILMKHELDVEAIQPKSFFASPRIPSTILVIYSLGSLTSVMAIAVTIATAS